MHTKRGCRRGKQKKDSSSAFANPTQKTYRTVSEAIRSIYNYGRYELGLTKEEIKDFIGDTVSFHLYNWLRGQTCGVENGKTLIYRNDIEHYLNIILKEEPPVYD